MNLNKVKGELKDFISAGEINLLLVNLKVQIVNDRIENQLTILQNEYRDIKDKEVAGTLSPEAIIRQKNDLNGRVLKIIDSLTKKDLKPSIIDDKSELSKKDEDDFKKKLKLHGLRRKLNSKSGKYTYKREYVKFRQAFNSILVEYSQLGNYTFKIVSDHSGIDCNIDDVEVGVQFCPRSLIITIIQNTADDEDSGTADIFGLYIDNNENCIWVKDRIPESPSYSSSDLAKLILTEVFEWLMEE